VDVCDVLWDQSISPGPDQGHPITTVVVRFAAFDGEFDGWPVAHRDGELDEQALTSGFSLSTCTGRNHEGVGLESLVRDEAHHRPLLALLLLMEVETPAAGDEALRRRADGRPPVVCEEHGNKDVGGLSPIDHRLVNDGDHELAAGSFS
jgi:hypothetical protein